MAQWTTCMLAPVTKTRTVRVRSSRLHPAVLIPRFGDWRQMGVSRVYALAPVG